MEAKQKAIAESYGKLWGTVAPYTDHNGWVRREVTGRRETNGMEPHKIGLGINQYDMIGHTGDGWYRWRLTTLREIDHNNGWIRCDERLPGKLGDYYICINGKFDGQILHTNEIRQMFERFPEHSKPSHWQPVVLPKPPIY